MTATTKNAPARSGNSGEGFDNPTHPQKEEGAVMTTISDTSSPRPVAADQPRCPVWCRLGAEGHESEALDPRGSWFRHERIILDDGDCFVEVSQLQAFTEQLQPGEREWEPAYVVAQVTADDPAEGMLSPTQADAFGLALLQAAAFAKVGGQR